jgi:hypothetical protein
LAAFLLFKFRKKRSEQKGIHAFQIDNMVPLANVNLKTAPPPKDKVRKAVFKWEKKLKNSYSRNRSEPFSQWIYRLKQQTGEDIKAQELIEKYQEVRYGDKKLTTDEVKWFQEEFNKLASKRKDTGQ